MSRTEVQPVVIARVVEEPVVDQHARNRRRYRLIRLVSILAVLAAWELVGRQIDPLFMSYPSAVVQAAYKLTVSGELPSALVSSLTTLALGFVIAAVLGVVAGLLIGRYKTVEVATDWLVNALYATPLVAVVPLVILWFGLGFSAKLFVVVLLAIFPILINTASGVRNVPPALIDVGAGFAATEWQVFTKVILPASLPYTMTGLRLGVGRAIIGMVVAEFFTAITGLGALVIKYGNQFDTASMLVPVLVLMLLGVALTAALRQAEARIAPWKEEEHN
jgi:ABC-type nitrate/sulfonate/bicarbonate transport system permease component